MRFFRDVSCILGGSLEGRKRGSIGVRMSGGMHNVTKIVTARIYYWGLGN